MKRTLFFIAAGFYVAALYAQLPIANLTPVQPSQSLYYMTPISSTAAVNNAVTLTIPAPATGLYNYVCYIQFNVANDATGTVASTNLVTTNTNFGTFAFKFSNVGTANTNYDFALNMGTPATGCAKSSTPGTATTFVSPVANLHATYTWQGMYYQGP